jgi:hypothetical protein
MLCRTAVGGTDRPEEVLRKTIILLDKHESPFIRQDHYREGGLKLINYADNTSNECVAIKSGSIKGHC